MYNNISVSVRIFLVEDRSTEEDNNETWMKRGKLLRMMEELERQIFDWSVITVLNKQNGALVVENELIDFRADDVESIFLLNRRHGEQEPVADCVACSFTSVL